MPNVVSAAMGGPGIRPAENNAWERFAAGDPAKPARPGPGSSSFPSRPDSKGQFDRPGLKSATSPDGEIPRIGDASASGTGKGQPGQSPPDIDKQATPSAGQGSPQPVHDASNAAPPPLAVSLLQKLRNRSLRTGDLSRRRWGQTRWVRGIGIERTVTVEVHANRVRVGDSTRPIAVGRGESREQLVGWVIHDVDEFANSWGPPPKDFYWVPRIRFRVFPGGNQYYERIRTSLKRGGLSASVEYLLGNPTANTDPEQ